jgi:hypothetical protein
LRRFAPAESSRQEFPVGEERALQSLTIQVYFVGFAAEGGSDVAQRGPDGPPSAAASAAVERPAASSVGVGV